MVIGFSGSVVTAYGACGEEAHQDSTRIIGASCKNKYRGPSTAALRASAQDDGRWDSTEVGGCTEVGGSNVEVRETGNYGVRTAR